MTSTETETSPETRSSSTAIAVVKAFPGPVMILFMLLALTGKLSCFECGFDRDYVCAVTKCDKEEG